ncbi:CBS domain-containing protein [Saprospiraceae bacterium]|nr:CBS domain-containing protein [Saprospiraceae bacterium]
MNKPEPEKVEFQDPLENYEPKKYEDPLEQALVQQQIESIRHEPFTVISPQTSIHAAVEKLAGLHIACLLVAENDKLVGVFSDRDVLRSVAFEYDQLKDRPVSEVMTREPVFVYESDSAASALTVMALCGYRHVPVLDLNEKLIGIISPQRITDFLMGNLG